MYYYIYGVAEFSFDSALKFLSIYLDIDKEADPTMERVGSGSDIPPSHLSFPQHALLLDNFLTPPPLRNYEITMNVLSTNLIVISGVSDL